jgi:hypothetical protein
LVAVGALFAFQALALVGAQVASAAVVSCSFGTGTLTVNVSGGTTAFSTDASGNITINGAVTDPLCTSIPATKATLTNTTAIAVTGSANNETVSIDLLVHWGAINWTVDLGGGTDDVTLDGSLATVATDLDTVAGASGIDLNDDDDLDVTLTNVESVTALGGDGDDYLCGSAGTTSVGGPIAIPFNVDAGAGYDDVCGGSANDTLNVGGAADGAVDYLGFTGPITVDLTKATNQITGTGVGSDTTDASDVYGSQGNDTFTGGVDYNDFAGGPGDDKITCGTGGGLADFWDSAEAVTVDLVAGTATGNGNDTLKNCADVYGSDFNDMIAGARHQDNWIDAAAGLDWIDYSAYSTAVTVTLGEASVPPDNDPTSTPNECDGDSTECDSLLHIENAMLGSGDDTFTGSVFNNVVQPGGGQNSLDGLGGGDTLDYTGYEEGVTVNLAGGGTVGDSAVSFENVKGSKQADNITGGTESNTIKSAGGNDNVKGGSGDDTLRLGGGNDTARGGSGDDDLYGAKGNDYLAGGGGTDLCKGGPGKDKTKGCEIGHK